MTLFSTATVPGMTISFSNDSTRDSEDCDLLFFFLLYHHILNNHPTCKSQVVRLRR